MYNKKQNLVDDFEPETGEEGSALAGFHQRPAAMHQIEHGEGQHAGEVFIVILNEFGQECKVVNNHMLSVVVLIAIIIKVW